MSTGMIKFTQGHVQHLKAHRAPGFAAAFESKAVMVETHAEISDDDWLRLQQEWPLVALQKPREPQPFTPPKPAAPKPLELWPMSPFGVMARTLKLFRTPQDTGAGDTIARIIGPIGGEAYKKWFLETFGKTCGCTERQEKINEQFPYENHL